MPRRVVEHEGFSVDQESLTVITIYESGRKKEEIKRLSPYSKRHTVLIKRGHYFEFK